MKILTALALVVSASIMTSTASAQPREERGGRIPFSERMRPQRPMPPPHQEGDWVNLATPTPTRHGTEWITVGRQAGAFRSLRIDAIAGVVMVRSVHVTFSNGQVATFYLGRRLDRRHPHAYIQFNVPRRIEQLVVTTARRPAGVYAIFGSWGFAPGHDTIASN